MSERVLVNRTGIRNFGCIGLKQLCRNELVLGDCCRIAGNGGGLLAIVWVVLFHIRCRNHNDTSFHVNRSSDIFSSGVKCIRGNLVSLFRCGTSSIKRCSSNSSKPDGKHRCQRINCQQKASSC